MGGNDTRVLARRSLGGTLFVAVWLALAPAQAQTITRGPLLQNPDKLASTMTILWWTNVAGDSVVDYGTSPALGSTRSEPQAGSCAVGSAGTCHQVTLTGLTPGTRYYYRLSTNGVVVQATTYFQTLRAAGDTGTQFFTVIGDWGQASTGEQQIANLQNAADPQMILSVGDNAYPNGTQSELDNNALAYYREPFKRAIYWPALGNHDLNDVGGAANYANSAHTRTFVLPPDAPQAERYYAFESGDALYVVTDSDSCCDSTQRNWLENQLATTTRKWKFVFLHHTPYSCANGFASIGSTLSLRDSWGPLFEQYGVDIVFTGHDHIYERSVLVDHYLVGGGNGSDGLGTRYVMTGGGGATLDEDAKIDGSGNPYRKPFFFSPTEPCPWLIQECPSGPNGYCSIERYSYASVTLVNNETLTVRGIDNNGTVFDTLVLTKANASPTPTASQTPTATHTQLDTPTQTATHTLVPTASHTATLTPTLPAGVPSQTPTATPTHTSTATVTRTATPTASSTHTPLPSDTPTATPTASVTQTPAPPTLTSTPSPTPTPTQPLSCTGPAPGNACVPGGGSRRTDCSFEWHVLAPTEVDARGFPKKRIACVEGDPACDADVNLLDGRCTFRVALCLNNADPRLPLCAAAGVTSFEILSPRASSLDPTDQDNFATLLAQVGSGGFGLTVISGSTILSVGAPNTNPDVCSAPLEIDVPLKSTASGFRRGRRVLRVSANTSATQRDRDKLILQCDAP